MKYQNEFIKIFRAMNSRHNAYTLFRDFVTMSAVSIHNAICKSTILENEYLNIAKGYTHDELEKHSHLLSCLILGLEEKPCDFLGAVFMDLEISSKRAGQFFTPYNLSKLMAKLNVNLEDINKDIEKNGYVTLGEPASGSGSTIIAFAEAMQEVGINYQQCLWVQAIDIDPVCSMMCYLHLSLLNIPAEVITGDTLRMDFYRVMRTPAHYIGEWESRFKLKQQIESIMSLLSDTPTTRQQAEKRMQSDSIDPVLSKPLIENQACFDF